MKNLFKILLFGLTIIVWGCKKEKPLPEVITTNIQLATHIITPDGAVIEGPDGIQLLFPQQSVLDSTEVTIGYSGNEILSFPNQNVQVIGKPFTLSLKLDTLQKPFQIKIPKPTNYKPYETAIIASINPNIPLLFEETQDFLIATFDNLSLTVSNSINNVSDQTKLFTISLIVKSQLPASEEMGLKEITLDNSSKMIFQDVSTLSASDKILILVHGWTGSPSTHLENFFANLKPLIIQSGYTKFMTFGYYSGNAIDVNGELLADQIKNKLSGNTIDIIAYSMGGLVARSTIENFGCADQVRNLITLGTPHQGTKIADLRLILGRKLKLKDESFNQEIDLYSLGVRDMMVSSQFIMDLMINTAPSTRYFAVAAQYALNGISYPFDGAVSTLSALSIPNQSTTNTQLFTLALDAPNMSENIYQALNVPHSRLVTDANVIQFVADKLNGINQVVPLPIQGLVAYYNFNGNALDQSGNMNHGLISGCTLTTDRHGNPDMAYSFDGINDFISINTSPSIESPQNQISIAAWIKPVSIAVYGAYFLCKHNLGNTDPFQYRLGIGSNSELYFGFKNSSNTCIDFPYAITIPDNTWIFVTATYDQFAVKLYVNGNLISVQSATEPIYPDSKPLELGRDAHGPFEYFRGAMDDVRIYNIALSEQQILSLYNE